MDQWWQETQLQLASLLQEYRALWQEIEATTDREQEQQLRAWANACIADYLATIWEYQTTKQGGTMVSP